MARLTTAAGVLSAAAWAAGSGCGAGIPEDLRPGQRVRRTMQQQDSSPLLGSYEREYDIQLPEGYTGERSMPLLICMHGWGGSYEDLCDNAKEVANKHGIVVVRPNGMTDGQYNLRSWNVGQAGRTDICIHKDVEEKEYTSCLITKNTSICNGGTCYDDVRFLTDLGSSLLQELCVDEERIFSTGGSYGAMMTYFLAPELLRTAAPWQLRGVLPWYGAFYRHMNEVPDSLAGTSLFHFHGIHDTEIPMDGSESDDGYIYDPVATTVGSYAAVNRCAGKAVDVATPFDGQGTRGTDQLLGCVEHLACVTKARVIQCNFDGGHGIWPSFAEELMWWFFGSLPSEAILFG